MSDIKIGKIVLNIGIKPDEKIDNALKILGLISGMKPVLTRSKRRSTFNVPKGRVLGCKVTIRKNVDEMLKKFLEAVENNLSSSNFDDTGNFSFGIPEYINIAGMKYDPDIGMVGLDVCVSLERPGFRIKRRKLKKKIGKKHLIAKSDAIDFVKNRFNVEVASND